MTTVLKQEIESLAEQHLWQEALKRILRHFAADSGTIHFLRADNELHLAAAHGIPAPVLNVVRTIPVGKGMAGLAVQRQQPVSACNIQTDSSGDVRPGAKNTGLLGSIVVPIFNAVDVVGALGIANRYDRTFTDVETSSLVDLARALARSSE